MASTSRDMGGPAAGWSSSAPGSPTRRRKSSGRDSTPAIHRTSTAGSLGSVMPPEDRVRRRSSTFSQYSFSEANQDFQEEIVDPGPDVKRGPTTWKSYLPIMFASLPPTAGLFFKNGTAFFSDLILLLLATVFLHWSITSPWKWYNAAQQVREDQEAVVEESLDIQRDESPARSASDSESPRGTARSTADRNDRARQADAALGRLQTLELMALTACFLAPALATYILYSIRYFLSRPSEGLVSNFNVGIFFLAAEVGPLSHSIKLLLAHTLHLQRVVNSNPYRMVRITPDKYRGLVSRLDELEARVLEQAGRDGCEGCDCSNAHKQQQAARQLREDVTRDVRAAVAPDIDGVVRAVRRYEKKSSALTADTEQRLADLRRRLDDVIALSAVVARSNAERWGVWGNVANGGWVVVTLPVTATVWTASLFLSPFLRPVRWAVRGATRLMAEGHDRSGGRGRGRGQGQHQEQEQDRDRDRVQAHAQVRGQPAKTGRAVVSTSTTAARTSSTPRSRTL
ncbi:hypothetical protein C8A01DRAFT_17457 [Parachaetomium inaequale]|uniref:Uncharacterized protein n=1 Tax=Parachaetomium inaequale TaxID=2588326 RepID=A0AAN6PCL8_9PEZI|nr:hypothetical protein C8A01DRAFT_17457 [Parachaetomium inaequale]